MTREYDPSLGSPMYRAKLDPARCKASVSDFTGWRSNQCSRKAKLDGWCKQHHPDTEAARAEKQAEKWRLKSENSIAAQFTRSKRENIELRIALRLLMHEGDKLRDLTASHAVNHTPEERAVRAWDALRKRQSIELAFLSEEEDGS